MENGDKKMDMSINDIEQKLRDNLHEMLKDEDNDKDNGEAVTPMSGYICDIYLDEGYVIIDYKNDKYKADFNDKYEIAPKKSWIKGEIKKEFIPEGKEKESDDEEPSKERKEDYEDLKPNGL